MISARGFDRRDLKVVPEIERPALSTSESPTDFAGLLYKYAGYIAPSEPVDTSDVTLTEEEAQLCCELDKLGYGIGRAYFPVILKPYLCRGDDVIPLYTVFSLESFPIRQTAIVYRRDLVKGFILEGMTRRRLSLCLVWMRMRRL